MDDQYLALGLGGMASAEEPFMAHFGAALLAAWWLDRDTGLSEAASRAMVNQADAVVKKHAWLFRDLPEATGRDRSNELMEAVESGLDHVWAIGHDVIYASLVVRTLQERPELACDSTVDGLLRVLEACRAQPLEVVGGVFQVGDATAEEVAEEEVADAPSLAKVALTTMLEVQHVYVGLHQGDIGHLADHAHGLLVLDRLGYRNAASRGRSGFRQHLAAIRRVRYLAADLVEVCHGLAADPRGHHYWNQSWSGNDWAVGHVFKYPYAFFDLLDVAGDVELASPILSRLGELVAES